MSRGLDNAGKTTICKSILHEDISLISPTLGFNIRTILHKGYSLNVWDIGGQTSLRPYWRNYFEQTDCIIWVVDSSDRTRIKDCKLELHQLLQQEVRSQIHLSSVILVDEKLMRIVVRSTEVVGSEFVSFRKQTRYSLFPHSRRNIICKSHYP